MTRTHLTRFLVGFFLSVPAFAQRPEGDRPPSLIVSGNGSVRVAPDEAYVRLGIVRQAGTARDAQDQANAVASAILSEIAKLGIAAPNIQTSRLTLSPVYANQRIETESPRIVGYRASNSVSVRVQNLAQIGLTIDAGLKAGSNQLEGVSFQLRDETPVRERALREAVAEGRRKAAAMADAMGVNLAEVLELSEGGVSIQSPKMEGVYMMRASAEPTPVSPGEVEITASVSIRYRIAPKAVR